MKIIKTLGVVAAASTLLSGCLAHQGAAHDGSANSAAPQSSYGQSAMQPQSSAAGNNYFADARADLYPPNPRPGECYSRVIIPAQYQTRSERVLVREASEKISITPAKYGPSSERVLVKEEARKLVVVPATYKKVTERVMVKPESYKVIAVPARYRTTTERILERPAYTEWKKGTGIGYGDAAPNSPSGDAAQYQRFTPDQIKATRVESTGEVMCLVEIPAKYKTIKRKELVSPATTKRVKIPAEYKTVTRTVVDRPATTREIVVPAKYKTVRTQREIAPARETRIPVPAKYQTISRKEQVSPERVEWRPVLCEINMTRENVSRLQRSLKAQGCYECEVDGQMGPCTIRGAQCYARPRGLPAGDKYITMEVIKSLGLRLEQ